MAYINRNRQTSQNRLSDRDMLLDLLATEKAISGMYEHGIMESATEPVRNAFEQLQHDEHENGELLFNAMQEKGWYSASRTPLQSNRGYSAQYDPGYSYRAESSYAVSSGARNFGSRLDQDDEMLQSGRTFTKDSPRYRHQSGVYQSRKTTF
ncbi:Hypothetical protein LUCI_3564 [Lucifera butyrica]|uniref:Uncharacterized protein n=1 Tax=Lucifera butyrica TaxID=1351585 RepID=A0A498RDY6_9FIRM|nr:spore coat protein [Lucifera butyrica]VBB08293.1 Hypothetical protein LUCI_3564 [Lucifera butyrica]